MNAETASSPTRSETRSVVTLVEYFYKWERERPNQVYLRQPSRNSWKTYTWKECGGQIRRMVSALHDMELSPQTHICLISKNCAHWVMCDLAIMMAGHVSVPVYPNLTPEQLHQVMEHSECKVLFAGKLDSLDAVHHGVPEGVKKIALPLCKAEGLETWDELVDRYEPFPESPLPNYDDLATIVYTSGTTGIPKGVMKTHYIMGAGIDPCTEITHFDKIEGQFFSYLPLNHDAERLVVQGGSLINGGTISFVESIDTFVENLKATRPTIFLAVPRIWTKFQMGVLEKLPQKKLDSLLKIPILSGYIKNKIRKGLGLDRLIFAISGAAPISKSTIEWYKRIGINICEGYGMTENTAICTVNPVDAIRVGTVGKPYPGCDLKIDTETQEVLMRSEWVMKGYYKNPELTAQVIKDGWLHTGDMGELTAEGYLKITGRVKDMFKTSKGEYIIPVPMERMFAANTLIEQSCVIGYGLPQPFILVNLSESGMEMDTDTVKASLQATLNEVNGKVADYERLRKLVVTKEPWTVENGILTPTLKVKRNILDQQYREKMESWYTLVGDEVMWES